MRRFAIIIVALVFLSSAAVAFAHPGDYPYPIPNDCLYSLGTMALTNQNAQGVRVASPDTTQKTSANRFRDGVRID